MKELIKWKVYFRKETHLQRIINNHQKMFKLKLKLLIEEERLLTNKMKKIIIKERLMMEIMSCIEKGVVNQVKRKKEKKKIKTRILKMKKMEK